MTTETWLPVPNYEGLYEVSDGGRVRSCRRSGTPGMILKLDLNDRTGMGYPQKYLRARLWKNRRVRAFYVHRLVLTAFDRPPAGREEVLHQNHDTTDNRLANLRWGTREDNLNERDARREAMSCRQPGEDDDLGMVVDPIDIFEDPFETGETPF